MGLPEKLAYVRFHHHGNMASLNNILYQLGLRSEGKADEIGKYHYMKAIETLQLINNKNMKKIIKKGRKIRGLS